MSSVFPTFWSFLSRLPRQVLCLASLTPCLLSASPTAATGSTATATASATTEPDHQAPYLIGADISALPTFEAAGAIYRRHSQPANALALLTQSGINTFRLRLFVAPNGEGVVNNDLLYTLALARRVRAAGATFILDLHYSDTWADPAKQYIPAAWVGLSFEALVAQVQRYTRETLQAFAEAGLTPDYVQLGNEITNGMLWPAGKVEYGSALDQPENWQRFTRLLSAAAAGLRDVHPAGSGPRSIIHIESTRQPDRSVWFFRHLIDAKVPFDVIGFSYYPDWHGNLAQLRKTLRTVAYAFGRPILLAETAYPSRPDEHWNDRPNLNWPLTPQGQLAFLRDVDAVVRELPDGLGLGVIYWHPEAVPVDGLSTWVGGSNALFAPNGEILPGAAFALPSSVKLP